MVEDTERGFDAQGTGSSQWDLPESVYRNLRDEEYFALPPATLARLVLCDSAATLSELFQAMVATNFDRDTGPGAAADQIHRMVSVAVETLAAAVVYERAHGTSWDTLGDALGTTGQAAQERFRADVARFEAGLDVPYTLGGVGQIIRGNLPRAALAPRTTAERLDRWLVSRNKPAHRDGQQADSLSARPVSTGTLDRVEHRAAELSAAIRAAGRRLTLSLQRRVTPAVMTRRIHLERDVACCEAALRERPEDPEALQALAAARSRLAEHRSGR
ncbi:hypothetical protein [Frankia gtarii]|uniref:hypothetical protein n=1 Tax=Frankia gtarii TaxID=2950102 RepID=UPI0021BE383A|nr:hypothetical protein [Frankia gtarii]